MAMAGTARTSQSSQPQWKPLPRMRTHEQVIAEIESRLIAGSLKPGDRLPPERQFAEALGVSRGAVREALRILEAIGVVEAGTGSGPSSGSVIVIDSAAGMALVLRMHLPLAGVTPADLTQVRLVMEGLAARPGADCASGGDVAARNVLAELLVEALREAGGHRMSAAAGDDAEAAARDDAYRAEGSEALKQAG